MRGSDKALLVTAALLFVLLLVISPWGALGCAVGIPLAIGLIRLYEKIFD